jgi:hypothetical protein
MLEFDPDRSTDVVGVDVSAYEIGGHLCSAIVSGPIDQ